MLTLFPIFILAHFCSADIKSDHEIKSLPLLDWQLNFKQYSGRLNVSDTRSLSYWLVESQSNKDKDPLVLWMNGGPGCSSFFGLLMEHGPFRLTDGMDINLNLTKNPDSWNNFANVLYLETPAGVGFSTNSDVEHTNYSDDTTAEDNLTFLRKFLEAYPEYKGRDFYITGESYGGCLVPSLANHQLLTKEKVDLVLKGVAIGNGVTDDRWDSYVPLALGFHGAKQTLLQLGQWMREYCPSGFDNLCEGGKVPDQPSSSLFDRYSALMNNPYDDRINEYDINRPCFNNFLCGGNSIDNYLNRRDVQKAMHFATDDGDTTTWNMCNMDLNKAYDKCKDITDVVRNLMKNELKILYFYGETDTIGKNPKTAPWFVDDLYAGTKTTFDGNLTYTTIADCGHMAAGWKPKQTARAVHHFINDIRDWNN
ncbi:unnamed protein product [Bursaphelenchus xylophilus]|uniref:Carboxypeptidase n=1 Tax=Bursaphelenchus xylophilus TaxID=6326 RepID=A0A811KKS1_BURXY|nr:unnamed protein product [Bursaphelenchus xylophilus]CAG9100318.1 unnamed protein product [Bursaphelenchus xylophilus]